MRWALVTLLVATGCHLVFPHQREAPRDLPFTTKDLAGSERRGQIDAAARDAGNDRLIGHDAGGTIKDQLAPADQKKPLDQLFKPADKKVFPDQPKKVDQPIAICTCPQYCCGCGCVGQPCPQQDCVKINCTAMMCPE